MFRGVRYDPRNWEHRAIRFLILQVIEIQKKLGVEMGVLDNLAASIDAEDAALAQAATDTANSFAALEAEIAGLTAAGVDPAVVQSLQDKVDAHKAALDALDAAALAAAPPAPPAP